MNLQEIVDLILGDTEIFLFFDSDEEIEIMVLYLDSIENGGNHRLLIDDGGNYNSLSALGGVVYSFSFVTYDVYNANHYKFSDLYDGCAMKFKTEAELLEHMVHEGWGIKTESKDEFDCMVAMLARNGYTNFESMLYEYKKNQTYLCADNKRRCFYGNSDTEIPHGFNVTIYKYVSFEEFYAMLK